MNTLLLDQPAWDLVVDSAGNIAMASDPYSLAQDAASQIKTFQGEVYYDTTLGVPYWQQLIGRLPPLSLVRSYLIAVVLQVPEVVSAKVFISSLRNRLLSGQVQITAADGQVTPIGF